jgi:hypothetical protein
MEVILRRPRQGASGGGRDYRLDWRIIRSFPSSSLGTSSSPALSTPPQNKVTMVSKRHSGKLLAGIQKNSLDTGLRRYDELTVDSYLCGPVFS